MAVEFVCDGCGKREPGVASAGVHRWIKPRAWFQRSDDGIQDACSRKCIEVIAEKSGKTSVVLPI